MKVLLRSLSAPQLGQQIGWVDRLGENLELVALGPGLFQQIGGSGLAGKQQNLALRQLARVMMAASMPVMPVMMTSLMSMSG